MTEATHTSLTNGASYDAVDSTNLCVIANDIVPSVQTD